MTIPEHDRVLYATEVLIGDLSGDEVEIVTWRTPEEIEDVFDNADGEDFIRIQDVFGTIHKKRKEVVTSTTISRVEMASAKRARKPAVTKEGTPEERAEKILKTRVDRAGS